MYRLGVLATLLFLLGAAYPAPKQSKTQMSPRNEESACERWRALVDPQFESGVRPADVEKLSEDEAVEGIVCLLAYKGSHKPGAFSGATRFDISQSFPDATIELDALYAISAIYHRKWAHARGIALVDQTPKILRPKAAGKRAFVFVGRWYQRLREKGLETLRKEHDDPLRDSGLRWY